MAQRDRRHPDNVPGPWFVDDSCIDCDASRQCAPELLAIRGGQSVVARQPETPAEVLAMTRAMLVCPTASIGTTGPKPDVRGAFPQELAPGVFLLGHASESSFGANSFFARRPGGNVMIDAPRWVPSLAARLEELGGLAHVLLTHEDDVADAERWAAHFGARTWIHEADRRAAPFATDVLSGRDARIVDGGLVAIPVPGHTRGSVVYLLGDTYLFTGDSLYWSRSQGDLAAFHRQCWYSWEELTRSLGDLLAYRFEWVLAGHGDRRRLPAEEMRARLEALVRRMQEGRFHGPTAW
jgi:glyoxylase-like metal-dependent hydrolase (beta-lactamase superfamily II)